MLWILVSDQMAALLAPSKAALSQWQTVKGAVFVLLSAGVVAALVWREYRRLWAVSDYWRTVVDSAPVGFWLIDTEARTVWVNDRLAELLGYSKQAMRGRTPYEFVDAANRTIFEHQIGQVPHSRHRHYEIELQTAGGQRVPTLFNATTLWDEAGEPAGSFAFVSDMSEPQRREEALRQSQTSLRRQQDFINAVIDHLPGPFFVFDRSGRMVWWNRHLVEAMGFPDHQVLTMDPLDFFTDRSQTEVRAGIRDTFQSGRGSAEGVVQTPDGGRLPYRLQASRLNGYGEALAAGLGVDISREKAVEASLERSNRALRTLSRVNAALVKAQDEATLLQTVCDVLVDEGGYREVWVGFLEGAEPSRLAPRAVRTAEGALPSTAGEVSIALVDPESNPIARARESGEPVVIAGPEQPEAVSAEPSQRVGWSPGKTMVLPLGEVPATGFLVVCSGQPDGFTDQERSLLEELARDLDFGLQALRTRTERERHLARLRQSAAVFQQTAEGIAITDTDARIVAVNDAFTRITGYTEAEVLGRTPRILSSGLHDRNFYREMWQELKTSGTWQGEIWNRRKDGEVYPEWETISEVRDEAGNLVNYVAVFSDITKARRTEEELSFLTYHDPLTELPNRALFRERLEHSLERLAYRERSLALAALDVEGFGRINESLGPAIGDAVLQEVARRLSGALRPGDTLSRPGGDEFWLLLEDLGQDEDAAMVVQQLLGAVREPLDLAGHTLRLEATAGLALAPQDGRTVDELTASVTTALQQAKQPEAAPVQYFRPEMGHTASRRLTLEQALRRAIEGEELRVWYQPQVDLATGRPLGLEALVRWQHPEWGLVSPGEFIPVAEASGLVVPLGEWVLEQAIHQFASWRAAGHPLNRLGINVAAGQLNRTGLADRVGRYLARNDLSPGAVELEITEEGFLTDLAESRKTLEGIAELGVRLAIDDFGTGYSSLAYLKRLNVDTLKIDKSFIDGLPEDEDDRSIVDAVLAVAGQMGLETVAEGVETEQQAAWLRQHEVALAQGFLWCRPQPPDALEAWLQAPG